MRTNMNNEVRDLVLEQLVGQPNWEHSVWDLEDESNGLRDLLLSSQDLYPDEVVNVWYVPCCVWCGMDLVVGVQVNYYSYDREEQWNEYVPLLGYNWNLQYR
jgi:hypothetical protein